MQSKHACVLILSSFLKHVSFCICSLVVIVRNIIQIHNIVSWDWKYPMEYPRIFPYPTYYGILSIPHNIIMDLNNGTMLADLTSSFYGERGRGHLELPMKFVVH